MSQDDEGGYDHGSDDNDEMILQASNNDADNDETILHDVCMCRYLKNWCLRSRRFVVATICIHGNL